MFKSYASSSHRSQLIIDLFGAGQIDHVDYAMSTGRHPSRAARILDPLGKEERELDGPHLRPGLGNLAISLQEDADTDCVFVHRSHVMQPFQRSRVDFSDPTRDAGIAAPQR